VHHGRAVGLCLRAALGWNAEADPARHARVAQALGVPAEGRTEADVVADLAPAFDRFVRAVGLAVSLAKDGLGAADAERLAAATMAPENKAMRDSNIREIAPADARRIAEVVLTAA
jgi:alcohol dehydrogenase class IV